MITISQVVEEIINQTPFLEEALAKRIVNHSSLARLIRSEIEDKLYKTVKTGAIIMALRRQANKRQLNPRIKKMFSAPPDMIVRSNLIEFTFSNSDSLLAKHRKLLERTENQANYFFTITQGVFETGIIVSQELKQKIKDIFKEEKIVSELTNLSSITIKLPEENVTTPGVYYFILKALAWQNINIVEVISTYQEITLILASNEIDKAFSILKRSLLI